MPVSHRGVGGAAASSVSVSGPCASLFEQNDFGGEHEVAGDVRVEVEVDEMPSASMPPGPTTPTLTSATPTRRSPAPSHSPSPSPPPGIEGRTSRSADPENREKARLHAAARPKARAPRAPSRQAADKCVHQDQADIVGSDVTTRDEHGPGAIATKPSLAPRR